MPGERELHPFGGPDWWTDPDLLERVFMAALKLGDSEGVGAALRLMACVDPERAGVLLASLSSALHAAGAFDLYGHGGEQ